MKQLEQLVEEYEMRCDGRARTLANILLRYVSPQIAVKIIKEALRDL